MNCWSFRTLYLKLFSTKNRFSDCRNVFKQLRGYNVLGVSILLGPFTQDVLFRDKIILFLLKLTV